METTEIDYEIINWIVCEIDNLNGFDKRAFDTFSLATDVQDELSVDGEDAFDLMDRLFERFSIQQGDYDHFRYFLPELFDIYNLFRSKHRRGDTFICIGMLHDAAKAKVWDSKLLEAKTWSSAPLYTHNDQIPIKGFNIRPV